jgi:hypothetical protein
MYEYGYDSTTIWMSCSVEMGSKDWVKFSLTLNTTGGPSIQAVYPPETATLGRRNRRTSTAGVQTWARQHMRDGRNAGGLNGGGEMQSKVHIRVVVSATTTNHHH